MTAKWLTMTHRNKIEWDGKPVPYEGVPYMGV